jgi:predicted Zn-dependent protease
MVAAGFNPQGMVDTFKVLMKESGGKGKSSMEEWVSTHPDNKKRIETIEKRIAQSKATFAPQIPRKKTGSKAVPKGRDLRFLLGRTVAQVA